MENLTSSRIGNQPPWILPTKGKYFAKDAARASARVGKPTMAFPDNFMAMARKPITALRALHYIKQHYAASTFISTFHFLFHKFWTPPHANVSDSSILAALLLECPEGFDGHDDEKTKSARKMFTNDQVNEIIAGTERDDVKQLLKKAGDEAIEKGAFGAPWLWVVDDKGKGEAFFGSDRFGYVYQHLGVPHTDVQIFPKL
jgi:2-hydroxychromene-2-carboxylate isomerase